MSKKYRDFDSITFSQIRNEVRSGRAQFIAIDQRGVVKGDVFIKVLLAMCTGSGHLHDTHKVGTILSSCITMCSILLRSFSALSRVCAIGKLKLKYLNVLSKFNKSVVFFFGFRLHSPPLFLYSVSKPSRVHPQMFSGWLFSAKQHSYPPTLSPQPSLQSA